MAHLPSQSSVIAPSQLGRACSLPSKLRSRGRAISTLPPWKPILPFVLPQRCAVRSLPRPWRGPHAVCASTSIISPSASSPAARQSLSKLADMLASASIFNSLAGIAVDVISLFMALLSSRGISTPSPQPSPHFSHDRERLIERFLIERSVLIQIFAKSRNEWPQKGLRHVWDQLIEHAALPEQRMGSVFGGVDLEMAVHAEAFAGGAEQRQKHDGEGVQKKKPVAPLRIGDAKNA